MIEKKSMSNWKLRQSQRRIRYKIVVLCVERTFISPNHVNEILNKTGTNYHILHIFNIEKNIG